MELADDRELPGIEGDGTLAPIAPIPSFALKPIECARLQEILNEYAPYKAGQTALFWHIVGLIGDARRPIDLEQAMRLASGTALSAEIAARSAEAGQPWRCQNMAHKRYLMFHCAECETICNCGIEPPHSTAEHSKAVRFGSTAQRPGDAK